MNHRKQIVVIGLGQFGFELATTLAQQHDVLALDQNEERVNAISDLVQRALILDAGDFAALQTVVDGSFDEAIISIGEGIEASILCALHLKKLGVTRIRAKALNPDHAEILSAVGASEVMFPERESARRLAQRIAHPNLLDFVPLTREFQVMEVEPPPSYLGRTLIELDLRNATGLFIIAIKNGDAFSFLPSPNHTVRPGDVLVAIGKTSDLDRIMADRRRETETGDRRAPTGD